MGSFCFYEVSHTDFKSLKSVKTERWFCCLGVLCISCSQDNTKSYIKYIGDLNICLRSTVGYPAGQIFKKRSKIISGKCLISYA